MAIRISTKLRNNMLDGWHLPAAGATSGSLVVGTRYLISDFNTGDVFTNVAAEGATVNATNKEFVATGTTPTTWTNASTLMTLTTGGGIKASMRAGFINIYTGPQPLTADTGATGTLLGTVTLDGDGVTGLTWDGAVDGVLSKAVSESWKFTGLAAGTAGWWRAYISGDTPTNVSTTHPRVDGNIATTGGDMALTNLTVSVGAPNTVSTATMTMPAS